MALTESIEYDKIEVVGIYKAVQVRKAETSKAIPTTIKTYRTAVRTACLTRETEIDNCADTAALVTLYGLTEKDEVYTPNMTQYPEDPNA